MWYSQASGESNTLLVAFANLAKKYDHSNSPVVLQDVLLNQGISEPNYHSLTSIYSDIRFTSTGDGESWPTTDSAIVTFEYTMNGDKLQNHCAVADHLHHTVVDSRDGQEKSAFSCGEVVSWAAYNELQLEEIPAKEADNSRLYTLLEGETIWGIARRFNVTANELAEHNGIEPHQMYGVHEGYTLHLPEPRIIYDTKQVQYDPYDKPRKMHVVKEGGAKKHAFGNPDKGIEATGATHPQYKNLIITGLAHVPVIDLYGQEITMSFYMDALSMGDFIHTGKVANTTGFHKDHLEEGHVTQPVVAPRPEIVEKLEQMEVEREIAETIAAMDIGRPETPEKAEEVIEEAQVEEPTDLVELPDPKLDKIQPDGQSVRYLALEDMFVNEYYGKGKPELLEKGKSFTAKYRMMFEDDLYLVHYTYDITGKIRMVPANKMMLEDDLFTIEPIDLQSRVALHGHLTLTERYMILPLSRALTSPWVKAQIDKLKTHK